MTAAGALFSRDFDVWRAALALAMTAAGALFSRDFDRRATLAAVFSWIALG